jgi:hypothetical protein
MFDEAWVAEHNRCKKLRTDRKRLQSRGSPPGRGGGDLSGGVGRPQPRSICRGYYTGIGDTHGSTTAGFSWSASPSSPTYYNEGYNLPTLSQMWLDSHMIGESKAPTNPNVVFSPIMTPRREGLYLDLNNSSSDSPALRHEG